jgi:hypothetical protein
MGQSPVYEDEGGGGLQSLVARLVISSADRVKSATNGAESVRMIHRRSASGEQRRPTKTAVISSRSDVRLYLKQRRHAHRVAERRRYVLHLFVSFTLFSFVMALVCFIAALEFSIELPGSRDGDDGGSWTAGPLTVENGFNFLWATFVLVLASIIANIVMKAHFEPQPLFQRIHRHAELITASAGVVAAALMAGGAPLFLLQRFCLATAEERAQINPWLVPLPAVVAMLVWQVSVVVQFRRSLRRWWAGAIRLNVRRTYEAAANSTPLYLGISMVSAVVYWETQATAALVAGSLIPLVACAVLGTLFLVDFLSGAKGMDGLASASLYLAMATPIMVMAGVLRGLTMVPVAVAAGLFFAGHAQSLMQLLNSVDELEVLIASGRSSADEDDGM